MEKLMSNSNISAKHFAANGAPAQTSTGPASEEGKRTSSRNAGRHHLTGQVFTMTDEDRAACEGHLDAFMNDFKPQGALETTLVHSVAHGFWRLHRAEAIEENYFALEAKRNEHTIECINSQITEALLHAMAFFENPRVFVLLTLYEQRIHVKTHKDLKILLDRQASRPRAQQIAPLEKAIAAAASGTYSEPPRENGFVFSNAFLPPAEPGPIAEIGSEPPDSAAEIPKVA